MAAATTDSAEQDAPSPSSESGALLSGEAEEKTQGLQAPKEEPVDSEAIKMEEADGEQREGEGDVKPPVVPEITEAAAAVGSTGEDEEEEEDMGCELTGAGESPEQRSPESCSDTGDGAEKELKQEQREENESSSSESSKPGKGDDGTEKNGTSSKRRASVEMSSSDGEPLSRMDSEDSISSTLMDMESTASSGRSTPAMMNGQGSATPSSAKSIGYTCCWDQCHICFSSSPDLAEHIRGLHVDGQRGGVFVCLWKGCKVYNTPSTSQSWLQRHMLTHSGDKPFKCVVGGCNASFASQGGLARHVPTHFSQQNSSKPSNQPKVKEESPSKAGLNKRRKLKNKRRRSLPRPHDFFDAQTMDAIRHRAICLNLATHMESLGHGHSVVFHSTVIARRKEDSGKVKVLLHWTPEDILPDVWVNETDRPQLKTKVVHLSQLPQDTAVLLDPNIYRTLPQKRLKRRMFL
ncbi:zinc finger protein AEBP2-like [Megalops cyprinoides]|uniref:zinc finger protein AEBP2-like n=1 Tax=Megalops cyprinoides TaxID=118141 RepID=UPI0018653B5C|nr:zinc finger protein AEBP2-like [Megalops cyprinoides]